MQKSDDWTKGVSGSRLDLLFLNRWEYEGLISRYLNPQNKCPPYIFLKYLDQPQGLRFLPPPQRILTNYKKSNATFPVGNSDKDSKYKKKSQ